MRLRAYFAMCFTTDHTVLEALPDSRDGTSEEGCVRGHETRTQEKALHHITINTTAKADGLAQ